jgi:hypothetical protein
MNPGNQCQDVVFFDREREIERDIEREIERERELPNFRWSAGARYSLYSTFRFG